MKGSLLLAGCVCLLALPSAVLAFSADFTQGTSARSGGEIDPLASETTQENLSRAISMRSLAKGQLFPFTPAGTPNRPDRAVTVAVRVDPEAAQAIIVRGRAPSSSSPAPADRLHMAPTAFNLGVSRGYQNFAQNLVPQAPARPWRSCPISSASASRPAAAARTNRVSRPGSRSMRRRLQGARRELSPSMAARSTSAALTA
ncbi:hypothetical protein ACFSHP_03110 [Novosphingobium panipatense]